jgi:RNase P/RNase MRP subunit p29
MNNRQQRRQTRKQRIREISRDIDILSAQLNQLIIEDNQEDLAIEADPQTNNRPIVDNELAIGDRVEITNNYRRQRGLRGTVTHLTAQQVSLHIDGERRVINKKKTNVRKINNP